MSIFFHFKLFLKSTFFIKLQPLLVHSGANPWGALFDRNWLIKTLQGKNF